MGLNAFLNSKYATTHENRFWNKLVSKLKLHYASRGEHLLLIGNLIVDGKQLDALVIKEDGIAILDFKNYGGTLKISPNSSWTISGNVINHGKKNPYIQLSDSKYGLLDTLKRRLPPDHANWINLGHINAIVLFHQEIDFDNDNIAHDLSPKAAPWFSITDFEHICQTLDEITSNQTLINLQNLICVTSALGLEEIPEYKVEVEVEPTEKLQESIHPSTLSVENTNQSNTFSENYYSIARGLHSIELLIIGQDPYPNGGNGVAFCKTTLYGLYEKGCSGGIVMESLGYSRQRALNSYENSKAMFIDLLKHKGICLTNINPHKLSLHEAINSIETTNFNNELIKKAKKIVLLGKGQTKDYFERLFQGYKPTHTLIHPSARNEDLEEWQQTWQGNLLQKILESS